MEQRKQLFPDRPKIEHVSKAKPIKAFAVLEKAKLAQQWVDSSKRKKKKENFNRFHSERLLVHWRNCFERKLNSDGNSSVNASEAAAAVGVIVRTKGENKVH